MKDKILFLIIGILIGAIITAGGFLTFGNNSKGQGRDKGGEPPQGNFMQGERLDGGMMNGQNEVGQSTNQNAI